MTDEKVVILAAAASTAIPPITLADLQERLIKLEEELQYIRQLVAPDD